MARHLSRIDSSHQFDYLCIVYMIIELLAIGPHFYRPFSTSNLLLSQSTPRLYRVAHLAVLARLPGVGCSAARFRRLYETVGKGVTPPDSSNTEQGNDDESQSHQDPSDPGECLGGDDLVAVD